MNKILPIINDIKKRDIQIGHTYNTIILLYILILTIADRYAPDTDFIGAIITVAVTQFFIIFPINWVLRKIGITSPYTLHLSYILLYSSLGIVIYR